MTTQQNDFQYPYGRSPEEIHLGTAKDVIKGLFDFAVLVDIAEASNSSLMAYLTNFYHIIQEDLNDEYGMDWNDDELDIY